jgi:hypothetical protein
MKNPFTNETVKSAAIVIGSAVAFIAISKGVAVLRKKFGGNPKVKAIFDSADKADCGLKHRDEQLNACRATRHDYCKCSEASIGECVG